MGEFMPGLKSGAILDRDLLAEDRAVRIGAIQRLDYHEAVVLTHDKWKETAGGIPQFSYLLATARNSNDPHVDDDEVLLLRVEGTAPLSLESDLHAVREEALRSALARASDPLPSTVLDVDMDPFTKDRAAFTGLRCRILGTFYEETIDGNVVLQFGSDVDNFYATSSYRVLKPVGKGLSAIVSFTRPERGEIDPVTIGRVRYSATRRRAITSEQASSPVEVNMNDFIGNKTALLGMTRSGKSNTAKIIIGRTFVASERRRSAWGQPIGQLIFDPQGEYANPNTQDGTEIAGIGPNHIRIYKFGSTGSAHERPLGINFFDDEQIRVVQNMIASHLREATAGYVNDFAAANFVGSADDPSQAVRASRGRLILYASLLKAGFAVPSGQNASPSIRVSVNNAVKEFVVSSIGNDPFTEAGGARGWYRLKLVDTPRVVDAILAGKTAQNDDILKFCDEITWTSTEPIYTGKSGNHSTRGYRNLIQLKAFHNPNTKKDVSKEIYADLLEGRIVIVDLHIGTPAVTARLSEMITEYILDRHTVTFTEGIEPAPIQVMLEEAHNLFAAKQYEKDADVWVRLAKEASKLKIGMIYATQEVSGVAHQVKANTANWVVSHLNNTAELKELSKFYDFSSFADAILASEDRGYVRLKTLSSPFVIPVQIEKYDVKMVNEAREAAGLQPLQEKVPASNPAPPAEGA